MTARYITAQDIINRAAVECGLTPSPDVWASTDPAFVQLRNLLTTCGQDLCESYEWEILRRSHSITTVGATDTGAYDLPADFGRMINQTGWEETNRLPVTGPMTEQQWTYLKGRNLINSTIYISFKIHQDKYNVYPDDPVPDGLEITFSYISRNWVIPAAAAPDVYEDTVQANGDTVLFKPNMIVSYLRYKFLDAKGFDTGSAVGQFSKAYLQATGGNDGAPVLNAGRGLSGIPLLDYRNIPITNYGS